MNLADRFLTLYDGCKERRTPQECRKSVMDAAPGLVRAYLISYDGCLKLLPQETCRKLFAPPKRRQGVPLWALFAGVGIALVLGRSMGRKG